VFEHITLPQMIRPAGIAKVLHAMAACTLLSRAASGSTAISIEHWSYRRWDIHPSLHSFRSGRGWRASKEVSNVVPSQLDRNELEFLRRALKKRQLPSPITELSLHSIGKSTLFGKLGAIATANHEGALALIEMALALHGATVTPNLATVTPKLVWTGPDVFMSPARPTTVIVTELLHSARERVLIVGYEFDHGPVLFAPLHAVMRDHGVKAAICFDVPPAPSPKTSLDSYLAIRAHQFLKKNWTFGEPAPELFYFRQGVEHGSRKSLHAKCIVVDSKRVLIGSANFTKRGHTRNVEVGVSIENAELAGALLTQFDRLIDNNVLVRLSASVTMRTVLPEEMEAEEGPATVIPTAPSSLSEHEMLANELLVSIDARRLFLRILGEGLATPDVGEDIEGMDGNIVGCAELSWADSHVAILLPEQWSSRNRIEAAGWTCFAVTMDENGILALRRLLTSRE
jgi:hypothetical protein